MTEPTVKDMTEAERLLRPYLLNVSLAATAGKEGDLTQACRMVESAVAAALAQEREKADDALRAENARLTKALEFYADTKNYRFQPLGPSPAQDRTTRIQRDDGRLARTALRGKE